MNICEVDVTEVYRYLGFQKEKPDDITVEQVAEARAKLEGNTTVKGTYQLFSFSKEENTGILLENTNLVLTGQQISLLLEESHHCILMAVTLGHEVERWIRELQIRDMAKAVILDACASSLIEQYCNQLEKDIQKEMEAQFDSVHFTDRFSPGYGDLPLTVQGSLCKVLQTDKKIGLTVSATHLMSPKKSITAILGIADRPQPMRIKGCGYCNLKETCAYRKGGKTCGS